MIPRNLSVGKETSFFLFGARGTGKSTLLREQFGLEHNLWIDLLNSETEQLYGQNPAILLRELEALAVKGKRPEWVIIDEVQKVPKLLDIVHTLIEKYQQKFALTGSSARKLKRGHANLLGGRASVFNLFPFTASELGVEFKMERALNWGTLPRIYKLNQDKARLNALRSYTQLYLKEEVLIEQLVRNVTPFRGFLEISAQMNCERLNYQKIARDVGVDHKTIQTYFDILEDTHLGFRLPAFHLSIRKSQLLQQKFYWFDGGVQRFLSGHSHAPLMPKTSAYGDAFEAWMMNEIFRLNHYLGWDARLSYLQTKNGTEIDLILTRAKQSTAIEIKSSEHVDYVEIGKFEAISKDIPGIIKIILVSQDKKEQRFGKVDALFWMDFLTLLQEKGPF